MNKRQGIYWNNHHHHLISTLEKVSGKILWLNLHWLFWMLLLPVTTSWLGAHLFKTAQHLCMALFYLCVLFLITYCKMPSSIPMKNIH
ncbi:TMEM175 family protein [Enterococcus cecorum]|uniref:TMEM175 family protein n=1 Tax=Enterococcus cecorum TaxID=44008 RepID=UPI001FADA752|nr:TMEM175 family protein [Enterococcus cecorum]